MQVASTLLPTAAWTMTSCGDTCMRAVCHRSLRIGECGRTSRSAKSSSPLGRFAITAWIRWYTQNAAGYTYVCPQSGEARPKAYAYFESKRQTLKYRCPAVEYRLHCAGCDDCHRMGVISPNTKQRIMRIKTNDGKHPMRTFGPCPRNTRKLKQTFDRRNSLERFNVRVGCDFLLDDHFLRGKSAMHLRFAGSMAVMLAIALGCLEKNKPDMRSLVTPLAA